MLDDPMEHSHKEFLRMADRDPSQPPSSPEAEDAVIGSVLKTASRAG